MCWNADVSLNTFLFSGFINLLAYFNGVTAITEFIYFNSFIIMQLFEYFIWKGYNNRLISQFAFITILLQPIFVILCIKEKPKEIIPPLLVAYVIGIIALLIYQPLSKTNFSMTPADNGHLAWNWMKLPLIALYLSFYIIAIFFYLPDQPFLILFLIILLGMSLYYYYTSHTFGTMWCWFANVAAFYWLYLIAQKNKLFCGFIE